MSSPWTDKSITSPATKLILCATDPLSCWATELRELGVICDEADAVSYWSLLSSIYALTEEEHLKLRATDAYRFSGGSAVKGKRKLVALIRARLVLTAINPAKRNEKFVSISQDAKNAVLRTLDRLALDFEADAAAYRNYRNLGSILQARP